MSSIEESSALTANHKNYLLHNLLIQMVNRRREFPVTACLSRCMTLYNTRGAYFGWRLLQGGARGRPESHDTRVLNLCTSLTLYMRPACERYRPA